MLDEITIRTELSPGDMSYVVYKQTLLYQQEHDLGLSLNLMLLPACMNFARTMIPKKTGFGFVNIGKRSLASFY